MPTMSVMSTVILPLQLKFGSEKGRVALFVICGFLAMVIVTGKNLLFASDEAAMEIMGFIQGVSIGIILLGINAVCVLVGFITYSFSVKILENKEL